MRIWKLNAGCDPVAKVWRMVTKTACFIYLLVALPTAFAQAAVVGEGDRLLPAMIHVDGGVISIGTEEVYVSPFSIAREAVVKEDGDGVDCQLPSLGEYLMAAKLPDLKVGQGFENLETPPDDACTWTREVLEAEGVEGNFYFAGIGTGVPAELEFIYGGTNPRDSISRIHSNIFIFWDDEYKPSPRLTRCVAREAVTLSSARVKRGGVPVKARRSASSTTKMTLGRGTEVTVIYTGDDWSFISAAGPHPCQSDPEWTSFEDTGWIRASDYR